MSICGASFVADGKFSAFKDFNLRKYQESVTTPEACTIISMGVDPIAVESLEDAD